MPRLFITNPSVRAISSMMYSGKVFRFEPHTSYPIDTSDEYESAFYLGLRSIGLSVGTQPLSGYPINVNTTVATNQDSIEVPSTDTNEVPETPDTDAVADQILDEQLSSKLSTEDTDPTDLLVDISVDNSGRSLSDLDAGEYKTILNKLGVTTTVRSTSKLRDLVLSNLPTDKDWRMLLVEGDD